VVKHASSLCASHKDMPAGMKNYGSWHTERLSAGTTVLHERKL
jgi:hypothetical protein